MEIREKNTIIENLKTLLNRLNHKVEMMSKESVNLKINYPIWTIEEKMSKKLNGVSVTYGTMLEGLQSVSLESQKERKSAVQKKCLKK